MTQLAYFWTDFHFRIQVDNFQENRTMINIFDDFDKKEKEWDLEYYYWLCEEKVLFCRGASWHYWSCTEYPAHNILALARITYATIIHLLAFIDFYGNPNNKFTWRRKGITATSLPALLEVRRANETGGGEWPNRRRRVFWRLWHILWINFSFEGDFLKIHVLLVQNMCPTYHLQCIFF